MFHGGALQKLLLATIKVCCVRHLEKANIACRSDKNLLCALAFRMSLLQADTTKLYTEESSDITGLRACFRSTRKHFIIDKLISFGHLQYSQVSAYFS